MLALLIDDVPPLLLLVGFVMGIVWLAFPFVVMSRLADIRDHLAAMRGEAMSRKGSPPDDTEG